MRALRIKRRAFLRLVLLAGIGASAAALEYANRPLGIWRIARWTVRSRIKEAAGRPAAVALGECRSYNADVLECLRELWNQADMPEVAGKRVLVKPNLIDIIEGHPTTTEPAVVGAVVDLLHELGAGKIVVGEGTGFRREAWPVVEASGLAAVLAARGTQFVDLNYDDPQPIPAQDGWFLHDKEIWMPRHVREADLIVSVPKLKCHHWAGVSLGLKNLIGVVPGSRYGWPKNMVHINGIPLSVLGLYQSLSPVVTIVDGVVGMEGDGPLFGTPVSHGMLAVGADAVAVDLACAELMGFPLEEITYLHLAKLTGVGNSSVELRGASPERLRRSYQKPPTFS